ncbi:MAG: UDP-N-acetylmuramoyl-L-alanyl-D-glutamate--2,6-diaminopimelate ligase [Frankiaceae bacterium]
MPTSPRPRRVEPRPLAGLRSLLPGSRLLAGPGQGAALPVLTGVTHDSRAVRPGDLYLARPGERAHGAAFSREAVAAGAVAVLTDDDGAGPATAAGVPVVVVADPRVVAGPVAAWVHGNPADGLLVLGVTGTNGKTTTTYLIEAGLRAAGHVTGLIGTVETRIAGSALPSVRTTPEATDLQALFAVMRERGVTAVAMEVSSHALALSRVDGTRFAVSAFTNLSQDHLDFHADLEDYYAAKARLFTPALTRTGVADVDDPYGARLAAEASVPMATVAAGRPADWAICDVALAATGSRFSLTGPDGAARPVAVNLPGRFNVDNAAVAAATLAVAGVPVEDAVRGLGALDGVPGRMQRVDKGQPYMALVDYAHTPEAVGTLLAALRPVTGGRLVVVLGCGGDRDQGKRPLMGAAAALGADIAVLTSDNPRSEDPAAILQAILAGAVGVPVAERAEVLVEPDRRRAIEGAVALARAGDTVVVAGKGHETGQEAAGRTVPFDDRAVLAEAIDGLAASRDAAGTASGAPGSAP